MLGNLTEVAQKEGWDKVIPAALQKFSKYDGKWVAAPVNVHSTNWVWVNKAVLDKLGIKRAAELGRIHRRCSTRSRRPASPRSPMAARPGRTPRSSTRRAVGRRHRSFYKKAFDRARSQGALVTDTMKTAFDRMAKLRGYVDPNFSGRDWNLASAMVIKGEAGLQIMGDWAKGEFISAGKKPGTDFVCFRFPGTQGIVTFNSDQFAMFKVGADKQAAQVKTGVRDRCRPTSSRPSTWSRARSRPAPTCRTPTSTIAARRASRISQRRATNGTLFGSHGARPCRAGGGQERHLRRRD